MKVDFGKGKTGYGPGVQIDLTGNDVATAIDAYLVAHGIHVQGARTVTVNGELCKFGGVYVDPSGNVIDNGKEYSGRGNNYKQIENKTMGKNSAQSGGLGLGVILFLIFMVLKLTDYIDWSWWWVTAPLWGGVALVIGFVIIMFILALIFND